MLASFSALCGRLSFGAAVSGYLYDLIVERLHGVAPQFGLHFQHLFKRVGAQAPGSLRRCAVLLARRRATMPQRSLACHQQSLPVALTCSSSVMSSTSLNSCNGK